MKVKVTTDWHCGVKRAAGTTPASAIALQGYILDALQGALDPEYDHLIAGDLLNDFTVETHTLIAVYDILSDYLRTSGKTLGLLRGNHDHNPRGTQKSSFDLLGNILTAQFGEQVKVVTGVTEWRQFILVPHLPNNDLLKMEVEKLYGVKDRVIVFHANYDNFHAQDSVSSLNLTEEMISTLIGNGNKVLLGHEHDHRTLFGGNLLVLGNGVPSSVADCLGSGYKFSALFDGLDYDLEPMVKIADVFHRGDWTDTEAVPEDALFVRVEGNATADQAAEVVAAVAKLRQKSDAYVVGNAVKIEGMADFEALAEMSFDDVSKIDVLGLLLEELDEREQETVRGLLK